MPVPLSSHALELEPSSFGQSCSVEDELDESVLESLILEALVVVLTELPELCEPVAVVAASACPTPIPPTSVPAARVEARTACRSFQAMPDHLLSYRPRQENSRIWESAPKDP
jgi:hypothetical protein